MFTGLVQHHGRIRAVRELVQGRRLTIEWAIADLQIGESIAVNGVCLTVVSGDASSFSVEAAAETLGLTTVGKLKTGDFCNLERALRLSDRLGGHLVSGHVDGLCRVKNTKIIGESIEIWLETPAALSRYIATKGSVTLDGVSLTVNQVDGNRFSVLVIRHTQSATTLSQIVTDRELNLEVDLLARYVERLVVGTHANHEASTSGESLLEKLSRAGFS